MSNQIGTQIRMLRKARGLTQADLASAVSISVQAVSKWECGGTPDVDLLPMIAAYLNVSIDRLYGFDTAEEVSVDELVQQEMRRTPQNRRVLRACEIGFAAFKGLSGISNIVDLEYTDPCDDLENACSRCRILYEDGVAYASADRTAPSVLFLPEPTAGYRNELLPTKDYVELFSMLADEGMMRLLFYLYQRRAIPFSWQHIAGALALSEKKVLSCLNQLRQFGWIEEEDVELESGTVKLYRPILSEAFIAFIYFVTEMLRKTRLWFISNVARDKPLLK